MTKESELTTELIKPNLPSAANGTMRRAGTEFAESRGMIRPRDVGRVKSLVVQEATAAGEAFYFDWGSGKNRVTGPSQELAFSLARIWGNCIVQNDPAIVHADSWEIPATFIDLETGFSMTRSYIQSRHWTIHGNMDPERKNAARFGLGQSKAARNIVLKCLPRHLIAAALDAARSGVREAVAKEIKAKGLKETIKAYWTALRDRHQVSNERILDRFGYAKASAMTAEDVVTMRSDLYQLDNGQEFAENLYPEPQPESKPEDLEKEIQDSPSQEPKPPKQTAKKKRGRPRKKRADPMKERIDSFLAGARKSLDEAPSAFECDVVFEEITAEIGDEFGTELDQQAVKDKTRTIYKEIRGNKSE